MALTTIPSELSSVSGISDSSTSTAITIDSSQNVSFAGTITATAATQAASDNSTKLATTAYVTTALANLVVSAPGTLNTLNELAAALGDDANFSTTITNSIATKLSLTGGTLTGGLTATAFAVNSGGSTSDISGTAIFRIMGSDVRITNASGSEAMATFAADGAVSLFHDASTKLATTSTGISVTGDFVGSGTIRGTRLGGNAAPDSNYAINTLQNGSMTHAGYFQANGDDIGIEINATAGTYSSSALYVRQSSVATGGNLARFANSAGDKFLVSTAGNVSIGTVNTARRLNIKSGTRNATTFAIEDASSTEEVVRIGQQGDGDGFFQLRNTAGAGTILLDASGINYISGGNVGIGTSNPTEELHVNSDTSSEHTRVHITKGSNAGTAGVSLRSYSASNTWTIFGQDASASKLFLYDGSDYVMTLTSDTNRVGIGTTNPTNPLCVKQGTNVDMEFLSEASGTGIQSYNRTSSAYGYIRFLTNAETMRLDTSGNLLIGDNITDGAVQGGTFNITKTSASPVITLLSRSATAGHQGTILLQQTTSTSGGYTATGSGRALGLIGFRGVDAAGVAREGAGIRVSQSGSAVTGSINGEMFFRTKDIDRMKIDYRGIVTTPYQPAFQAYKSAQSNLSINNLHVIAFQNERFDVGSNFDGGGSNSFSAPVTGKYQFNVNVRLLQLDTGANYIQVRLVTSNRTYEIFLIDPARFSGDLDYFTFGGSILADMDENDAAYVAVYQSGGNSQLDIGGGGDSHFSGYLVA